MLTYQALLRDCIGGSIDALKNQLAQTGEQSVIHRVFKAAETGLSYQYHAAWDHVLHILATVFEVAGRQCSHIMVKVRTALYSYRACTGVRVPIVCAVLAFDC